MKCLNSFWDIILIYDKFSFFYYHLIFQIFPSGYLLKWLQILFGCGDPEQSKKAAAVRWVRFVAMVSLDGCLRGRFKRRTVPFKGYPGAARPVLSS